MRPALVSVFYIADLQSMQTPQVISDPNKSNRTKKKKEKEGGEDFSFRAANLWITLPETMKSV